MHEVFVAVTTHPDYLIGSAGTILSLKGDEATTLQPSKDGWGYPAVNLYAQVASATFCITKPF
jgi:hypothetical protein